MGRAKRWLCWALTLVLPVAEADIYKYVDERGNVIFSDEPLTSPHLRLEWKRSQHTLATAPFDAAHSQRQQAALAVLANRRRSGATIGWSLPNTAAPRAASSPAAVFLPRAAPGQLSASMAERRAQYRALIEHTARQHGLWPELLHAVIRAESGYRPDAVSVAGACGLMQLMPETAARFEVRDIWDPAENLRGGARYLRFLLDLFGQDLRLALAAYNAGENAVRRYGNQVPPYPETQEYVVRVLRFLYAEREGLRS